MEKIGESLCHRIKKLSNLIQRQFFENNINNAEFVTPLHGCIIGYIYENNNREVYQKELESVLKLRRSTITTILKAMEKNDLIERTASEGDLRTKRLVLTRKAEKIHEKIFKRFEEIEIRLTRNISEDELRVFESVINKMNGNLEDTE